MKKPLKDLGGSFVNDANGQPQRLTKRAALQHGRGEYRLSAPRVLVRDVGTYWLLEREPLKN